MALHKEYLRSEMYFKNDFRVSSELCLATPRLGMSLSMAGLDRVFLLASRPLNLVMTKELHLGGRVYNGGGGLRESITFVQHGIYYNKADVVCNAFLCGEDRAPAETRFEVSCVGDIITAGFSCRLRQSDLPGVAVLRLRGAKPQTDGERFFYEGQPRIYISGAEGAMLEISDDELIIKQPVLSEGGSVGVRFCVGENRLFFSPPLACCVEAASRNHALTAEYDRRNSMYIFDDQNGKEDSVELLLENPFEEPVCMPVMLCRRATGGQGAVLLQNGQQTGIPVQISCERVERTGGLGYFDYVIAPVLAPGQKLCLTLELTKLSCACHVWDHSCSNQLERYELTASGGSCTVDLARSRYLGAIYNMVSFADIEHTRFAADLLNLQDESGRMELRRCRLTEIMCGPLEATVQQEAYSADRKLCFTVRQSMLISRDYTRVQLSFQIRAMTNCTYSSLSLLSFSGKGFYFGNDVTLSFAAGVGGEGLRIERPLLPGEYVGFDGIGAVLRTLQGCETLTAQVYAFERNGESGQEVRICLPENYTFNQDKQITACFVLCILPTADAYCGKDVQLEDSLSMRSFGQLMRREVAAGTVGTAVLVGNGEETVTVQADTAHIIQTGGIGIVPIRLDGILNPAGRLVFHGDELPSQLYYDHVRDSYRQTSACLVSEGAGSKGEREYKYR